MNRYQVLYADDVPHYTTLEDRSPDQTPTSAFVDERRLTNIHCYS